MVRGSPHSSTRFFRNIAVAVLSALFLLSVSSLPVNAKSARSPSLSPEEEQFLESHGPIVFVSQTDYPPFESLQEDGSMDGMSIEIARWMSTEMGYQIRFLNMPFKEAQQAVLSGKADVITSLFFSNKRAASFDFTEPLFDVPALIYVGAERPDIVRLRDLAGKRIAIQNGDYAGDFLESKGIKFELVPTTSFTQAIDAVLTGAADALIGDEQIVRYVLFKKHLATRMKKMGLPLYVGKNCMAVKKNNAILHSILVKSVEHARQSGVFDSINKKWVGKSYAAEQGWASRWAGQIAAAVAIILIAAAAVIVWNLRLRQLVEARTRELSSSEEQMRLFFERQLVGMAITSPEKGWLKVNDKLCRMFGYTREELNQLNWQVLTYPEDLAADLELFDRLLKGEIEEYSIEKRFYRKDGTILHCNLSVGCVRRHDRSVDYVLALLEDITDRERAKEALLAGTEQLRRSEVKYRNLHESMMDGYAYVNMDGSIMECNETFISMLGYTLEELRSMTYQEITPVVWHGLEKKILEEQVLARGYSDVYEKEYQRRDGTIIPVELRTSLLKDENGNPIGMWAIVRDLGERQNAQKELLKIQKLESLGVLAGGIAHDFNNIITGILGNISFARMFLDSSHRSSKILEEAEKASRRAADLAQRLLTFAKGNVLIRKTMSSRQLVEASSSLVLRGSNVSCVIEIPDDVYPVDVDEGQINQAFSNIIINAAQAMPEGGTITVRAENVSIAGANAMLLAAGEYVRFRFTDTGCGIVPENLKKIFDPYFTTKPQGSGLGLASAHSIVTKHGGHILVRSESGVGTTFEVLLPAGSRSKQMVEPVERVIVTGGVRGKSLLVMDDEEMIRTLANEMLGELGYRVLTCADGDEAIAMYVGAQENGEPFSAAILDLTIPGGMGGLAAGMKILELDPDARLIVSSGYSNDPVMSEHLRFGFCGAIVKPYNASDIAIYLDQLLSGSSINQTGPLSPRFTDGSEPVL